MDNDSNNGNKTLTLFQQNEKGCKKKQIISQPVAAMAAETAQQRKDTSCTSAIHYIDPEENIKGTASKPNDLVVEQTKKGINNPRDKKIQLDNDENTSKKNDIKQSKEMKKTIEKFRDEINSLKYSLNAARNEKANLELEHEQALEQINNQISQAQKEFVNSELEVLRLFQEIDRNEREIRRWYYIMEQVIDNIQGINVNDPINESNLKREVHLLSVISIFLFHMIPFGADLSTIYTFVHHHDSIVEISEIENILNKYKMVFRETSVGTGPFSLKKWEYIGE